MKKLSKIQKIVSGTVIAAAIMISGGPVHSNQEQPPIKGPVASLSADTISAVQGGGDLSQESYTHIVKIP